MKQNLNYKSKSAIYWDLSGSLVRQGIFLCISIILARLLDPEEFGILGMSMVFISISQVFTDVGFTSGLIQQKNTKDVTLSSVFFINLIISLLLSLVILISSHWIAIFYNEPKVKIILLYLAIIPPIAAVGKVHAVILTKNLNFKSLTLRSIIATLISGVLAIITAVLGYGVYSLVVQQISLVVVGTIVLWFSSGWRPKFQFSIFETKKLFSFSGYVFLDSLFRQFFSNIDTLFVGKVFSPVTLGFYSRAESLKSQANAYATSSISKVIFPVFSQLQDNEDLFEKTFFKAFNIITGLIIFLIAPIYFLAPQIIIFLFGEKWNTSILLFQILILTVLTEPHKSIMGKAILAKGYSKFHFKFGLFARLIRLSPIVVGLFFGIKEFTLTVLISSTLIFFILIFALYYKLSISLKKQFLGFILPNVIFIIFLFIHFNFNIQLNMFLFTLLFLVLQIVYLKMIKHDSYFYIKNLVNNKLKYKR